MKITPESMKKQYEDLWNTFCKKNHDYGSSFEQSLDKHGLIAGVVRMEDKMNRISTLVDVDKNAEIASESLADTLRDLSNYSAMGACWLMAKDAGFDEEYARQFANISTIMRNSTYGVEHHSDGGLTVFYKNGEYDSDDEYKLSNFEGHQEKVNEREYFNGVLSDHTIIKNWGLVGDSKTVRSRTTGQYLTEDDNPEVFRKIYGVLKSHKNFSASWKPAPEDIAKESSLPMIASDFNNTLNESQPMATELKGLENGYFIRQHINSDNSYRYTIAFNPEGTIKTQDGEEKPYLLECFGNDYDGMNVWAIHVFDTLEDMVAALNYDLKVRNNLKSKNFGESIKGLDIETSVYVQHDAPLVFENWVKAFGQAFDNNMKCKNLFSDGLFGISQGVKTFGIVFISEKTGALVVKGVIRERFSDRNHNFIWFSDTKEVLLELKNTVPKFNHNGIIYGIISKHLINGDPSIEFDTLYQSMEDKIISKFKNSDASELKNLVFFNEDEG